MHYYSQVLIIVLVYYSDIEWWCYEKFDDYETPRVHESLSYLADMKVSVTC